MCGRTERPVASPASRPCSISHRSIARVNSLPIALLPKVFELADLQEAPSLQYDRFMPRISSVSIELTSEDKRWLEDEYRRAFADERKRLCGSTDRLEIRIARILCESCFGAEVDGVFVIHRFPDVDPESWESDLFNVLDEDVAASFADDEDLPRCQSCRHNLLGAALYVETVELAERFSVSDEQSAIEVPKKRRADVVRLYGKKCFECGSDGPLEIDHINPRSQGGTAAFENLQPLCRKCGQAKADQLPNYIVIIRCPDEQ